MNALPVIPPDLPIVMAAASVLALLISIYFARPWLAGVIGNFRIQHELNLLQKKGATVLSHLQLPTKQGESLHIDHMIITNAQVIVLTTLGYGGEIFGSIRSATWTQETAQGRNRFPNPVKTHELQQNTIRSFLGDRLKVRTISAFTAGHLHGTDSAEVLPAADCAKAMHAAIEGVTTGAKQYWATNILKNVTLKGSDTKAEKERAFIARQGNEKHLNIARYTLIISAVCMLLAVTLAAIRLSVQHGLL